MLHVMSVNSVAVYLTGCVPYRLCFIHIATLAIMLYITRMGCVVLLMSEKAILSVHVLCVCVYAYSLVLVHCISLHML